MQKNGDTRRDTRPDEKRVIVELGFKIDGVSLFVEIPMNEPQKLASVRAVIEALIKRASRGVVEA